MSYEDLQKRLYDKKLSEREFLEVHKTADSLCLHETDPGYIAIYLSPMAKDAGSNRALLKVLRDWTEKTKYLNGEE